MRPLFGLCAGVVCVCGLFAADYDLLIRNARVVDGSGNPWFRADVAVKSGRIAAVGNLPDATATRVIDAAGRVLTPGFIDVHTHVEGAVEKVPRGDNYLFDGVTTVVTGNCGGSELPVGAWFSKLEQMRLGLNVATLIGHNSVRREIMGTANRLATPEEITRMQTLVEQAMREGAVGFSTGLIYIPGTYSNTDEVVALARAAAKYNGVYSSHMRDEGVKVMEAIEEAVRVGKEAGMRVELSHFKIDNKRLWGGSTRSLALVEKYRSEGVDVVVDQYPYDRSSTNLGITLPSWALADGRDQIQARLRDPETRKKIASEMADMLREKGQADFSYAAVASYKPERSYEGKTISEINVLRGRDKTVPDEIETILDMIAEGGAQMVYHSMGQEDVERIMRYPNTAVASDGGIREFGEGMPHPRSYGTNARVLAEFVRERKVLTLEDAVRRMTSLPARTFGFLDRGLIREGFAADLLLFDPAKVRDKATFTNPHQYTEGMDWVLVNGVAMVAEGNLTDARGGRVLRHFTSYDVLIRDARVVDGSGNPWYRADVAVSNGRIAAIGKLDGAKATQVIEAAGRVLAPGFIDVHTHVESGVERSPAAENFLRDGVTTVITGNCGGSQLQLKDWFAKLEKSGLGVNLASLIGHNSVRRVVMGSANRQATPEELERMRALVERGVREGAVGFSTGLEYIPGTYANSPEIISLAKVIAPFGGVYASHMRDEEEDVMTALEETGRVGREAGVRVEVSHLKMASKRGWGSAPKMLALLEKFRTDGVDIVADQYPYQAYSTGLGITVPTWAMADGPQTVGKNAMEKRLKDPATRARILAEMQQTVKREGFSDYAHVRIASCSWDHSLEGKTIAAINRERGRRPGPAAEAQTILDLIEKGGASVVVTAMSAPDVATFMRYPNTAVASDGGIPEFGAGVPHPRSYGTNARVLSRYVREQHVLTLEEAVRKMTSLPARTFRLRDRGLIREGYWADLVLFDPARLEDKATFEKPHQYSEGFDAVLVNGAVLLNQGELRKDKLAGRVLRLSSGWTQ